jgi:hypothetical protein
MRFRLMCDYSAEPAWHVPDGYMLSLDELPLSAELCAELRQWAERFESSWPHFAAASRSRYFATMAEEVAFEIQGLELWQRVRAELSGSWEAGYHSHLLGEDCWDPADPRLAAALNSALDSVFDRTEAVAPEHVTARPPVGRPETALGT